MRVRAASLLFLLQSATFLSLEAKQTQPRLRSLTSNNNAGKMDTAKNGKDKLVKTSLPKKNDVNDKKNELGLVKENNNVESKPVKDNNSTNVKDEKANDSDTKRQEGDGVTNDTSSTQNKSIQNKDENEKNKGMEEKNDVTEIKNSKVQENVPTDKKDGKKTKDVPTDAMTNSTNGSDKDEATASSDVVDVPAVASSSAGTGKKQGRIVGGMSVTNKSEFPFIGFPVGDMNCVATLFHDDLMLTAASCRNAFSAGVFLGGTKIDGSQSKRLTISKSIPHPDFDSVTHANDIMILKLSKPVTDVPKVKLNLDDMKAPAANLILDILGYGATKETGTYSETLQKARVMAAPNDRCTKYKFFNERTMVCSWFPSGGRDSCSGDAGGPVLIKQTYNQVAIISFGLGCGDKENPSVNTRVAAYSDFIKKSICTESFIKPTASGYCNNISKSSSMVNPLLARTSSTSFTIKGKKN